MSKFIMTVGLPGCGKSTYCKSNYNSENTLVLSSDALRIEMGFDPGKGNNEVFQEMNKRAKDALIARKAVVYDATNLSRKNRISTLSELGKYCDKKECLLFLEPFDVCKKRNKQRDKSEVVPDDVMEKMIRSFNVPMLCEGFDEIKLVQTELPTYSFKDLLLKTSGFGQDNSHHSMDLYNHLMTTKKNLFKLLNVSILPTDLYEAALYHDIGKLYTKSFVNAKGIETSEAHYYNHENVGAYVYIVISLSDIKSPEQEKQVLYTAALINWHMRPYLEMNPEKRKREYAMLGEKFVKDLLILHEADHLAH